MAVCMFVARGRGELGVLDSIVHAELQCVAGDDNAVIIRFDGANGVSACASMRVEMSKARGGVRLLGHAVDGRISRMVVGEMEPEPFVVCTRSCDWSFQITMNDVAAFAVKADTGFVCASTLRA